MPLISCYSYCSLHTIGTSGLFPHSSTEKSALEKIRPSVWQQLCELAPHQRRNSNIQGFIHIRFKISVMGSDQHNSKLHEKQHNMPHLR